MDKKDQGTFASYIDLFLRRRVPLLLIFLALFLLLGAGAMSVKTSFRARSLLAIGETESLASLRDDRFGRRQRPSTASAWDSS